jgi:hypothetical protein
LVPVLPVGAVVGDVPHRIDFNQPPRSLDGMCCSVDLVVRVLVKPIVAGALHQRREVVTLPERPDGQRFPLALEIL